MKFEFNESQISNMLTFLDRVELKGIKENHAFIEILHLLENPIQDSPPPKADREKSK